METLTADAVHHEIAAADLALVTNPLEARLDRARVATSDLRECASGNDNAIIFTGELCSQHVSA